MLETFFFWGEGVEGCVLSNSYPTTTGLRCWIKMRGSLP